MTLMKTIEAAFSHRKRPAKIVPAVHHDTHEYGEALHFNDRDWQTLKCDELQRFSNAIFAFTPDAFCYFLPGILSAGVAEENPELLVYDTLINMLDRSPDIETWDSFFTPRMTLLGLKECEAVQEWVLWLSKYDVSQYHQDSMSRAYETLELLKSEMAKVKRS